MQSDDLIDIVQSQKREHCAEFALVLASQAIESEVFFDGSRWVLSVAGRDAARARRELADYAAESRSQAYARGRSAAPTATGRPWPGVGIYLGIILGVALLAPDLRFGIDWLAAGRLDGARPLLGEWWRPLTALTLHADAAHLIGNALFGSFFGYSVARYLGGGFGWLLIIICSAVANFANAFLSGPGHRSIGASTAVFAALGILSAYLWRRGFPVGASRRERLAPVVAGVGLLAFTGTGGPNTDLGAHLLGFLSGFGGGLAVARLDFPQGRKLQLASGAAALGLILGAWIAAIS